MNVLEPIFVKTFISQTYACIKGRGIHKASFKLREYIKDEKYCLKLDIKKFYPSIDNEILKQLLRRKIKDRELLVLLDSIIDSAKGLPIGNYLSQYLANFYLTYLDHYIKEVLKVKKYLRYADDMVLLSNNKEELQKVLKEIERYLETKLNLKVKSNYQIFSIKDRGVDFVGYKHYPTHTLIRKSIKKRYIKHDNKKVYNGWLKYCNSVNLKRKYENNRNQR